MNTSRSHPSPASSVLLPTLLAVCLGAVCLAAVCSCGGSEKTPMVLTSVETSFTILNVDGREYAVKGPDSTSVTDTMRITPTPDTLSCFDRRTPLTLTIGFTNAASEPITDLSIRILILRAGSEDVVADVTKELGAIPPGESGSAVFPLDFSGATAGGHIMRITGTGIRSGSSGDVGFTDVKQLLLCLD